MSKKYPLLTNHWTGKPMGKQANKQVWETRKERLVARKMARSGHPGRRAQGKALVTDLSNVIRGIYAQDARENA